MDIEVVLGMLKKRADDLHDWADIDASEGVSPQEVEILHAEARQWEQAHDAVKALVKSQETGT